MSSNLLLWIGMIMQVLPGTQSFLSGPRVAPFAFLQLVFNCGAWLLCYILDVDAFGQRVDNCREAGGGLKVVCSSGCKGLGGGVRGGSGMGGASAPPPLF